MGCCFFGFYFHLTYFGAGLILSINERRRNAVEFAEYLPFWDKLTQDQQQTIAAVIEHRNVKKGTHM